MRKLEFIGTVRSDDRQARQVLIFPGRAELIVAPPDWPSQLPPGTLNIEVTDFPDGFAELGTGQGLNKFDEGNFRPEFVIPQRKIAGNPLNSDSDHPTRGFAQMWRADLQVVATGQASTCWMLRIIGTDAPAQLELVAEDSLRDALSLCEGTAVKVTAWEAESPGEPMTPSEVIADWCEAARNVEGAFGREKATGYLIGEKFLNFLEVAETDGDWRQAIPSFVAEVKALFEPWQLAEFLNTPRRLGALGHTANDEGHRMLRAELEESERTQEDARNLLLLEWAKELLLGEPEEGQ